MATLVVRWILWWQVAILVMFVAILVASVAILVASVAILVVCVAILVVCVCGQEFVITKTPTEKLGMSIKGGAKNVAAGPTDRSDEGIFISRVSEVLLALLFSLFSFLFCLLLCSLMIVDRSYLVQIFT